MIPDDLLYTKEHFWIYLEGNKAKIGITDFGQKELGEIVSIELPEKESQIKIFEELGIIESTKTVSSIRSPFTGKIINVNEDLLDTPEVINEDPYNQGWIVIIQLQEESEKERLLSPQEYKSFLEKIGSV